MANVALLFVLRLFLEKSNPKKITELTEVKVDWPISSTNLVNKADSDSPADSVTRKGQAGRDRQEMLCM